MTRAVRSPRLIPTTTLASAFLLVEEKGGAVKAETDRRGHRRFSENAWKFVLFMLLTGGLIGTVEVLLAGKIFPAAASPFSLRTLVGVSFCVLLWTPLTMWAMKRWPPYEKPPPPPT